MACCEHHDEVAHFRLRQPLFRLVDLRTRGLVVREAQHMHLTMLGRALPEPLVGARQVVGILGGIAQVVAAVRVVADTDGHHVGV